MLCIFVGQSRTLLFKSFGSIEMSSIQIIVGSMLGSSEYVAETMADTLRGAGHKVHLHFKPELNQVEVIDQTWIICTSTHGAGELPDNLKTFAQSVEQMDNDLSSTKFAVIGLGDSGYDSFCQGAVIMEHLLSTKGCQKIIDKLLIDGRDVGVDAEDKAESWIENNIALF